MDTNELLTIGISLYQEEKYSEAIEYFNQAISHDLSCAKAYHYRGLVCRKQRDKQGAIENLQQAAILLNDKEYTAICNKIQKLIEQHCYKESEALQPDDREYNWIFHNENWFESYDDLAEMFPDEFMSSADIYCAIEDAKAYIKEEFEKLERWLSKRLKPIQLLRQRRTNNAKFDKERLQNNKLPIYNSHEAIAQAMGVSVKGLRFLAFSRKKSQYIRFQIPKKTGGNREISAPKYLLKKAQNWILHNILEKLELPEGETRRGESLD